MVFPACSSACILSEVGPYRDRGWGQKYGLSPVEVQAACSVPSVALCSTVISAPARALSFWR